MTPARAGVSTGASSCAAEAPSRQPPTATAAFDAALEAEREALRVLFPLPPARTAPRSADRKRPLRNGAVVALVLSTTMAALIWADPAWRTEHHATTVGERRDVLLADGSTLTLDTATTLDVAWHLRSRRVTLQRGQARFAVAPSTLRPFEVAAADARIRVVGTVFDVYRHRERVRVTVLQGRVEVRNAVRSPHESNATMLLVPGQQWQSDGTHAPSAPQWVDLAHANAWQQGRLVFDRTPLREALADIQRYRPLPIRLRDDGHLGGHAVSGVFETTRTDQLLDLLPRIVPVRVKQQADGSVDIGPL